MSEELENSVREMLKEETWTRAGISNFTKNNMVELAAVLEQARNENCEDKIKEICDEQLTHSKDSSIVALYFSGMIALRQRQLDTSNLNTLVDIFEKNHKEQLIEYLCDCILAEDENNRFALRKLAEYYKASNNEKYWELYETIVKIDFEEADLAKILAERYESQGNKEVALNYYKKALLRYVSLKNVNSTKEIWTKLVNLIPEEIDFFLLVQRKIAKSISEDKSATLMQEPYKYYKETANWDIAIDILKLILSIDKKDSWARKEIISCFREKYAANSHLDDYITRAFTSSRDVFEAITDFEKHIAFDTGCYVFHRTWGVGLIRKVQGQMLTINFGKKNGIRTMALEMAVTALQPLDKDHIWVRKATKKKEELVKEVKTDVAGTLKRIIRSFENTCDDKRIKAELVPSILTAGEWTSWHAKAQQILATDSTFGVNPNDINIYIVRDHEISNSERLNSEFKAEKDFFARADIIMRFATDEMTDKTDDAFGDMYSYFANFLKSINTVDEFIVASYLITRNIAKNFPRFGNPADFTFAQLYAEIENPRDMYDKLKDTKNTTLKRDFLDEVRQLSDWDAQYIRLFPTVLKQNIITALLAAGKTEKLQHLVQDSFNDYRNYRDAAVYFFKECRNEDWFKEAGISYEKQLVTLVNVIFLCYREIASHVNTTDNKKTIKNARTLLFEEKAENGNVTNNMLNYMLANDTETISRLFTMVSDVKDLEPQYKMALRKGIINKYPDFKFSETEIRQEAPKGILVTAKKLDEARNEAEKLEKVVLPEIAEEVAAARALGDLKENAEYQAAKERQSRESQKLKELKSQLSRAVIFDPDTITTSVVSFGTMVTVHNNVKDEDETYTILGPLETDTANHVLSYLTPFASHLYNAKVGDRKEFEINGNKNDVTIKAIVAARI